MKSNRDVCVFLTKLFCCQCTGKFKFDGCQEKPILTGIELKANIEESLYLKTCFIIKMLNIGLR